MENNTVEDSRSKNSEYFTQEADIDSLATSFSVYKIGKLKFWDIYF